MRDEDKKLVKRSIKIMSIINIRYQKKIKERHLVLKTSKL